MEIKYFGGNCVRISTKKSSILIDDDVNVNNKSLATEKDIVARTYRVNNDAKPLFLIDGPGEYEVSEVSIFGIPAQGHMEESGHANTMYRIEVDDVNIGVIGHSFAKLTEQQYEDLGSIDILIIPIGGSGYTLDGVEAQKLIKEIEPKIVIPTHYDDGKTKYEVPQANLKEALKLLSIEPNETLESLKIKPNELNLSEVTRMIILEAK